MKQQNFKNHSKWVIGYHLVTFLAILALIIGSIMNLINSSENNLYSASLLVLVSFILLFSLVGLQRDVFKCIDFDLIFIDC